MAKFIGCLIIFIMALSVPSLASQQTAGEAPKDVVTITGRVRHFSFEGGFFGIEGDDGKQYKPLSLSEGFQVEGLHVKAVARIITKKLFFHAWGVPVEIISIERVPEDEQKK